MDIIKLYFSQRKKAIFVFIIFSGIFIFSLFLYNLPLVAILYPIIICLVLIFLFFLYDIRKIKQKHDRLKEISCLPSTLMQNFPAIHSQDDADYQAIIHSLRNEQSHIQAETDQRFQNMIDYYTIWVHQIKTPIAAMKLSLQSEDSPLSRQLSEELQRIEQYVEMVLAFLRLDSESNDYVFQEQDIDDIIKDAVKKFAGQFIRKKLRLCYEPLKMKVLTDGKWLTFVIEQLLSNALKYTNTGSITIEQEYPMILCIRDTEIGIAPEDLPRVFEKSYTGYNGRTDKKASGIGLYLCKRICDNLGHHITIESSLESGTVARINLEHKNTKPE